MTPDTEQRDAWAWLPSICAGNPAYPTTLQPYTVPLDDASVTIATDGHRLVMVREYLGYGNASTDVAHSLRSVLTMPVEVEPRPFDLAGFRQFIGVREFPAGCDTCHGDGEVECETCAGAGSEQCECHCGNIHEDDCDSCSGRGEHPCPDCKGHSNSPVQIRVHGNLFDARTFRPVIDHLPVEAATYRQGVETSALRIESAHWTCLFMPLRDEHRDEPFPSFPEKAAVSLTT